MRFSFVSLTKNKANITDVVIDIPLREGDVDLPIDFPFRVKNRWKVRINPVDGKIRGWNKTHASRMPEWFLLLVNVGCSGSYAVIATGGKELVGVKGDCIPSWIPNDNCETVKLRISRNGYVDNWSQGEFTRELREYMTDLVCTELETI